MSKYHSQRVVVDGHTFASKREAAHYCLLRVRQAAGEIEGLELQPRYPLIVNDVKVATYVADFRYQEDGETRVVDVKGMQTPVYKLKRAMMKAIYGISILEVK